MTSLHVKSLSAVKAQNVLYWGQLDIHLAQKNKLVPDLQKILRQTSDKV